MKSYLRFVSWSDNIIYFQAQGYWVTNNWVLADLTGNERCRIIAQACSKYVLAAQRPEGYWEYPNPEWRGRIAGNGHGGWLPRRLRCRAGRCCQQT